MGEMKTYRDNYIEENKEVCDKFNVTPDYVFDLYHKEVFPYLAVITDFRLANSKLTFKELAIALGVSGNVFNVMRKTFDELALALNSDKSIMKLKVQLDLQKGIVNTEHKNPKMIEMQGLRYDDDWKTKANSESVELPTTLNVVIQSQKLTDEERVKKSDIKVE